MVIFLNSARSEGARCQDDGRSAWGRELLGWRRSGIAKPLCRALLAGASVSVRDNVSMLVGMVLFTGLNYLGQRFFAFKSEEESA